MRVVRWAFLFSLIFITSIANCDTFENSHSVIGIGDTRYWKKDGSNGPATGNWDLGTYNLTTTGTGTFGRGMFNSPTDDGISTVQIRLPTDPTGNTIPGLTIWSSNGLVAKSQVFGSYWQFNDYVNYINYGGIAIGDGSALGSVLGDFRSGVSTLAVSADPTSSLGTHVFFQSGSSLTGQESPLVEMTGDPNYYFDVLDIYDGGTYNPVFRILPTGRTIIDPLSTLTDDTTSALQVNGALALDSATYGNWNISSTLDANSIHDSGIVFTNSLSDGNFSVGADGEALFGGDQCFFGFADRTLGPNQWGFYAISGGLSIWNNVYGWNQFTITQDGHIALGTSHYDQYYIDPISGLGNIPAVVYIDGSTDTSVTALQVNGGVNFGSIASGVGPPATHNTTGILYTDTATGLVYCQ